MMYEGNLQALLRQIYGEETAATVLGRLKALLEGYRGRLPRRPGGLSQRDSLVITYPDQVLDPGIPPLRTLADFCRQNLMGLISGIHILPFFPWTSDDGFSVADYRQVSPDYGTWDDIGLLAGDFRLMFDAVINHVSVESGWFKGFLEQAPYYQGYFIVPTLEADLSRVVRPRALPLLTEFQTSGGPKGVWTTFSADQADLNYQDPSVLLEIIDVLLFYVLKGADFIRLDAIAYLWKEPGTTCINLPETHAIVQLFRAILDELAPQVSLITETNVPHAENVSYFGDGRNEARLVYNFSLPPLLLHAFQTGSAQALSEWARSLTLPSDQVTFFNFLASHDGIGLNPLRGILPEQEIDRVIERARVHGGLVSLKSDPDGSARAYELNINYFDALNDPHGSDSIEVQIDRFVAAHAILLALQGVPGIYFHSLVGSRGWQEGVEQTGRNRTINREKLLREELSAALADPGSTRARVFQRLAHLLKARSAHTAFHPFGSQRVLAAGPGILGLERTSPDGRERVICLHNVSGEHQHPGAAVLADLGEVHGTHHDLVSSRSLAVDEEFSLAPYQYVWLEQGTPAE